MKPFSASSLKHDLPSSLVVFLVALPLCLGIAVASGAPAFSGVLAGIVGGIVVGALSGSHTSVSGPAAGLTVIVLNAITDLPTFEIFLATVVMAGVFQLILGFVKGGVIAYFFPGAVIKGMLAAIGLILIINQIPHAVGYDRLADDEVPVFEGGARYEVLADEKITDVLSDAFHSIEAGAVIIFLVGMLILILFEMGFAKKNKVLKNLPGALVAVLAGVALNELYNLTLPALALESSHMVSIPKATEQGGFIKLLRFPDFSMWRESQFWIIALTIALIASIETLLSLEAADKLDPQKRISPTNKELRAQGVGNVVSGLIGGLPVTAVIVRSSANITSGAKTKASAVIHGVLLLVLVIAIPGLLNRIPLSILAAVLCLVGYKLTKPALYKTMFKKGWRQFAPFLLTIIAILLSDLLRGIAVGMVIGLIFVLITNYSSSVIYMKEKGAHYFRLQKDVTFLNKAILQSKLSEIPAKSRVVFNLENAHFVDNDIRELILDFRDNAKDQETEVVILGEKNLQQL